MTQVVYFISEELQLQLEYVLGNVFCEDNNVIKVAQQYGVQFVAKYCLHQTLEGGRCVAQAKWHTRKLVQSKWCRERCLVLVIWVHAYFTVYRLQVKRGKPASPFHDIHRFVDPRQWMRVLDRFRIQCSIVTAQSEN